MNLSFDILFTVEVLNDYFTNLECAALDFVAADETVNILKGQQMLNKTIGNSFVVITKIDDTGKPYIALPAATKLRFYIGINDTDFANYTNINYRPSTAAKYYFSNLSQNKTGSVLNINSAVSLYNNTQTYNIGNLAADNTGNVFEAIKKSDKTNKHPLTDAAYWLPKNANTQYVNSNDALPFTGSSYMAPSAPATDFTVNVFGLNTATNAFDQLLRTSTLSFGTAQTSVPVDLYGLPAGRYKISANATDTLVYYDNAAVNQNILGVLEIFNHLTAANDFSLFDGFGVAKESKFTLRFANRSAVWRYLARTTDVKDVTDTTAAYTFATVGPATVFASTVPIPLKEVPISTLSIDTKKHGIVTPIGNPNINRLTNITQNGELYYCIEKHLNY